MLLYTGKVSIQEQQQSLKGIYLYYIVDWWNCFPFRDQDRWSDRSSWLMIAAKVISICWRLMQGCMGIFLWLKRASSHFEEVRHIHHLNEQISVKLFLLQTMGKCLYRKLSFILEPKLTKSKQIKPPENCWKSLCFQLSKCWVSHKHHLFAVL